ncbi:MAG TPA: colanic acid biosynthesis glycosyltransferase WcaL, partial [Cyanobacteria bacterium UBA11368]|nr:colanic acid biosynthesis glycosyltransferase WcaL [Cyanobacteria bacterium UBA11368]
MRIAFIVGKFPTVSETFILNQIVGLIERGHEVDIYADVPGDTNKIHADVEKYNLLQRTYYASTPSNRFLRILKGFGLLLGHGYKAPAVLMRSLNFSKYNYTKYCDQGT